MNSNDEKPIWHKIPVENEVYLMSVSRTPETFHVYLTNLLELRTEALTEDLVRKRCQDLNPLLAAGRFDCTEIITSLFREPSEYVVEATRCSMKFSVEVAGVKLKFALNLREGTPREFWEIITKPLCLSSVVLASRNEILLDLAKKKDEEIAEYKAQGAELIRKQIETKVFSEEQFKVDFPLAKSADFTDAFRRVIDFYYKNKPNENQAESNVGTSSSSSGSSEATKTTKLKETSNSKGKISSKRNVAQINERPKKLKTGLSGFI